jgi:hypothetical protein
MQKLPIHWDLDIRCRSKEQAHDIIKRVLKEEIDFPISIRRDHINNRETWIVSFDDMCWGNNLKTIAKFIDKNDPEA